jgi:2-polyprenyl-3-methyl-5-hydroxy-6-metoxy-1,4-benzoquinol methylase
MNQTLSRSQSMTMEAGMEAAALVEAARPSAGTNGMAASVPASEPQASPVEAFAERLMDSVATTFEVFGMYLGDRLGFYEVMAQDGPMTPSELAQRTGTHPRYVREWMEHQTVSGILRLVETPKAAVVDASSAPRMESRYVLPHPQREVLASRDSLNYLAPLVQLAAGTVEPIQKVMQAYREGGGVHFCQFGRDLREGQGRMNRAAFLQQLGPEWLASMPDVAAKLRRPEGARVADFGCGVGYSSIGVAMAYPNVQVDGFDLDEASILEARANAAEFGLSGRVHFEMRDAGDPALAGSYDLVLACECLHDMSDPVSALRTMRRLVREDGVVFVADERVADHFDPEAGMVEKLMYGFSVLHCLPAGMADQPSAGTGTVMRLATLQSYAEQAGFWDLEVLPIENPILRFYRLSV